MKQFLLCLAAIICLAAPCAAQKANLFADVPNNHWAYQDADTLQRAGIVFGNPDADGNGRRAITRHDFATAIAGVLDQTFGPHPGSDTKARLLEAPPALSALQELVRRFQPELARLNIDVDADQSRLMSLAATMTRPLTAKPFSDVPQDHWAASAVETLRRHGIVEGYPQGTFSRSR